jgi:repressor LexA
MIESPKLTARQQQILDLIQSAIARTGAPPTRAEIAAELGFKSANAAEEHLQALARKGVIELVSGTSRGIRLKSEARCAPSMNRASSNSPCPCPAWPSWPCLWWAASPPARPFSRRSMWTRPTTWKAACSSANPTTCSRCAACPCATPASWTATCWPSRPPRTPRTARSWSRGWVRKSPSSAFRRNKHLIELHAENPDYQTIIVEPGEPFEIEGLAVGLIRNTMLM